MRDRPADPARAWRGTSTGDPDLRILRFGGCEFREMPLSHTAGSEAGYPRHLAEALLGQGITVEFSDVFSPTFEGLPRTTEELRVHVKLTGAPDLILLQLGTNYSFRTILGAGDRRTQLRDRLGRTLGRGAFLGYRLVNPVVRVAGRPWLAYQGVDPLEGFVHLLRQEWPDAELLALGLVPVLVDGSFGAAIQERVSRDVLTRAGALGIPVFPLEDVVPGDRAFYCANGAQLNEAGSRLVADALLAHHVMMRAGTR